MDIFQLKVGLEKLAFEHRGWQANQCSTFASIFADAIKHVRSISHVFTNFQSTNFFHELFYFMGFKEVFFKLLISAFFVYFDLNRKLLPCKKQKQN